MVCIDQAMKIADPDHLRKCGWPAWVIGIGVIVVVVIMSGSPAPSAWVYAVNRLFVNVGTEVRTSVPGGFLSSQPA